MIYIEIPIRLILPEDEYIELLIKNILCYCLLHSMVCIELLTPIAYQALFSRTIESSSRLQKQARTQYSGLLLCYRAETGARA